MKLADCNNSSSLVVDNIEKVGERVNFSIAVFLRDERTDTNIRFETESFVNIDEWQQKSEELLSEHKLELENFSFHADLKQKIRKQNYFELSSNINKSRIKFLVESECIFGREFYDEISDVILYQRYNCDTPHVLIEKTGLYMLDLN